jgi:hypothetical protein
MSPESQIETPQELADLKLSELRTLISVLVSASTGQDTWDFAGFALMVEDKFQEFYDAYHQEQGSEERYQRYSTK